MHLHWDRTEHMEEPGGIRMALSGSDEDAFQLNRFKDGVNLVWNFRHYAAYFALTVSIGHGLLTPWTNAMSSGLISLSAFLSTGVNYAFAYKIRSENFPVARARTIVFFFDGFKAIMWGVAMSIQAYTHEDFALTSQHLVILAISPLFSVLISRMPSYLILLTNLPHLLCICIIGAYFPADPAERQSAICLVVGLWALLVLAMFLIEGKQRKKWKDSNGKSTLRNIKNRPGSSLLTSWSSNTFPGSSDEDDDLSTLHAKVQEISDPQSVLLQGLTGLKPEDVVGKTRTVLVHDPKWAWDSISPLVGKVFELSGRDNCIATKIDKDKDFRNCMMMSPTLQPGFGVATISFKLDGACNDSCFGIVRTDAACDEDHTEKGSTNGWFIGGGGGLWGNGKWGSLGPGDTITGGCVLTLRADEKEGSLKFWVNGKPYGPSFKSGLQAPLRWGANVYRTGDPVEVVPNPFLEEPDKQSNKSKEKTLAPAADNYMDH